MPRLLGLMFPLQRSLLLQRVAEANWSGLARMQDRNLREALRALIMIREAASNAFRPPQEMA
jgi:hypothetical protein